jgi:DNA polymerase-3 subunit epsilon/CBS domain-containing protein
MTAVTNATPLIALDAIVIDAETTGLDPARARLIEIAGVHLARGRIAPGASFRRLVRPDEPIPAASTRIHGIDDATVASAPTFAEVWPEFAAFAAGHVVIGHAIGFDLAVLKRECEKAGIAWVRPRTLDTRLLAEVAEPNLAGYALDKLAAWLEVEMEGRHSALGDAMTTARIFRALVPKLREGGIRTLAEAMQACRALTDVLDEMHRAGWVEVVEHPSRVAAERAFQRIDSYPYRHRVHDVMTAPPRFVTPGTSLKDALARMMRERISSLYVRAPETDETMVAPSDAGIVTERDVLRALAQHGADALAMPVERLMCKPLTAVAADDFVYRAISGMSRLKFRHLGVTDDAGRIVGALSARNLLRLRAGEAVSLGDEIDHAADAHDLGRAWARLPLVAASLVVEGVGGRDIAAVISRELGAATRAAAVIAERRMHDAGHGAPPCPYAVAVLGSAGRGESLLAMDQDNALVFAEGDPGGENDRWFEILGGHVADILHEIGVPYCKGGVMAKNPQWRGSVATWRERVADWIRRSRPEDLLSVDIFFDLRGVHGEGALANALWRNGFEQARGQASFAKLLAETAGASEAGLNLFGGFKTDQGRINLKKAGLFGIVSMARVLAIRHHIVERSTPGRLAGIRALGLGGDNDLEALDEAQATFLDLMLDQQLDDIEHGLPPTNTTLVKRLSRRDRERLRAALHAVKHLDDLTRDLLFRS